MRNPQILGILLPRATYWVLPGADAANSGTDSNADMAYHLTLDCIGRQLPFLLDFQGSALILVVRHQFSICICGSQCCLRLLPRQHLCWSALFGTLLQTCRQVSHQVKMCKGMHWGFLFRALLQTFGSMQPALLTTNFIDAQRLAGKGPISEPATCFQQTIMNIWTCGFGVCDRQVMVMRRMVGKEALPSRTAAG